MKEILSILTLFFITNFLKTKTDIWSMAFQHLHMMQFDWQGRLPYTLA